MFYDNGTYDTRILQSYTCGYTLFFFVFANNGKKFFCDMFEQKTIYSLT